MNEKIGTLNWARQRGGRLTATEKVKFLLGAAVTKVRLKLKRARVTPFAIDLDQIVVPDTAAVENAVSLISPLCDDWLMNHNFRTYVWGAVLAAKESIKYDEELLLVASLLHDLGLTSSHDCQAAGSGCFAVEGAFEAQRFAVGQAWPSERQDRLAEAICLHINLEVALTDGVEAHLLHEGAALDVVGLRFHEIALPTRQNVLQRYPRHEMKKELIPLLENQARMRPDSRMGPLCANGFLDMVQRAPFIS